MIRSLLAQFVGVLISIPVYGGVITTQTFDFGQATVTVTVLDNYHGDTSKEDWIYIINNLSFTTKLAFGGPFVGLSAFGGAFQGISMDHVSDVTGIFVFPNPLLMGDISPGFCVQCDLFGGWVLPDSRGSGVLPGQSATVDYSWLDIPGAITTGVTATAYLGVVDYSFGIVQGELVGSVLIPRTTVPEPPTSGLGAFALCLFAFCAWWRQQHRRIRASPIH